MSSPRIRTGTHRAFIAGTLLAMVAGMSQICRADEIYSPNVDYRELSVEYNGSRTLDRNRDKNGAQDNEFVIEAGVTPRLVLEASITSARDPGGPLQTQVREVEARYQFTEPGEAWLDAGLLVAYGFAAQKDDPDALEIKVLLQKDLSSFTSTANIGFSQNVDRHGSQSGGPDYVFLWNTRYRYSGAFQPGIEIQSDLGQAHQLSNFNQQTHYVGPAVWGKIFGPLPNGQAIKYQVAYLFGASAAASRHFARATLEYETHF